MLAMFFALASPWYAMLGYYAVRGSSQMSARCIGAILLTIPVALSVRHGESADGLGAGLAPLIAAIFAPLGGPIVLAAWASEAPMIGFVALAIGAAAAGAVLYFMRRRIRFAVVSGFSAFALLSWGSAELLVERQLRGRADVQFARDYCISQRASVLAMIESGQTDVVISPHATLTAGGDSYHWSFGANAWRRNAVGARIGGPQRCL